MINVQKLAPRLLVEMRYATTNNFTHKVLYSSSECVLNVPAARRLASVQKSLEKEGLGLKIWDCYRPLSVQQKLWDTVPDSRYVASPVTGSRHNRGASIDLTLVDAKGKELPMPTGFDDFSPRAHRDYQNLSKQILRNRNKLQRAMEAAGFMGLPTEWWHFDDPQWKNFALRNDPVGSPRLKTDKMTQEAASVVPSKAKQLLVVTSPSWAAKTASLKRFEKVKGRWKQLGKAWPVSLGSAGMAWGQGLHTALDQGPHKREGDKTAPAGIFKIGKSYGYQKSGPEEAAWPYQQVDAGWHCVDDPKSSQYNRIIKARDVKNRDWSSAEKMKRSDHLYKWVINIEQNFPAVLKGAGSCIFLHVWRRKNAVTEGCTAMTEKQMTELLHWLKPASHPHLIQLPKNIHTRVRNKWKLP